MAATPPEPPDLPDADGILALAEGLGLPPPAEEVLGPLRAYVGLVARWNRRTALVGPSGGPALLEVLLADALVLAAEPELLGDARHLLDVGAGAGAPLIPLLLLRPNLRATALEPRRRRVTFLRLAAGSLPGLTERLDVLEGRVDPAGPEPPAPADLAMSRATFPPEQWLRLAPRLAPEGLLLAARVPTPWPETLRVTARRAYTLPSGAPRLLLRFAQAEAG